MQLVNDKEYLTFDDVTLIPQRSCVNSRYDVSLLSGQLGLRLPIISANMRSVTGKDMAVAMAKAGGIGILHRFYNSIKENVEEARWIKEIYGNAAKFGVSIGVNDYKEALEQWNDLGVKLICIDVAHGHHDKTFVVLEWIRTMYRNKFIVIAGNVATPEATIELFNAGAQIVKVGIGPGSHCTTRVVTGHGVPQLTAIAECAEAKNLNGEGPEIIADGGIKNSGDIAKAIAAGADYVMLGKLLAGAQESPSRLIHNEKGLKKIYMGSASFEAKGQYGSSSMVEGVASEIPFSGPAELTLSSISDGLKSALSYSGAHSIEEFKRKAEFIRVSHASYVEGLPHGTLI